MQTSFCIHWLQALAYSILEMLVEFFLFVCFFFTVVEEFSCNAFSCNETFDCRRWCCGPCRVFEVHHVIALGSGHGTWKEFILNIQILLFRRMYLNVGYYYITCPFIHRACYFQTVYAYLSIWKYLGFQCLCKNHMLSFRQGVEGAQETQEPDQIKGL